MNFISDFDDRERMISELARLEVGEIVDSRTSAEMETLAILLAECNTLVADLRLPPPRDVFENEEDCRRAVELAEQVGLSARESRPAAESSESLADKFDRVGPYQIIAKLGQGGMGSVYQAIHDKLKRIVAVKTLPASRMKNAAAIERFEREMEAIGALNHPNIVVAHDAGELDGMHYLVMEYVEGLDLATLVRRIGPLPIAEACEIIRQAALGLKSAYERGIVHRDVKPSNLMLAQGSAERPEATVKVLDFGLARLSPRQSDVKELTYTGQIMGTLEYVAPEQCFSNRDVNAASDVYSLGATLYKLLSGNAPYSREEYESPLALLAALAHKEPMLLSTRVPGLPAKLVTVVERMIAKNPGDRYSNAQEVIEAMTPWTRGSKLSELLRRAHETADVAESPHARSPRTMLSEAAAATAVTSHQSMTRSYLANILIGLASLISGIAIVIWLPIFALDPNRAEQPIARNIASRDPFQHARNAARWIQSRGGALELAFDDTGSRALGPIDALPKQNFHLNSASLSGDTTVSGKDLAEFDELPFFFSLMLSQTPVDDAALRDLGRLPLLKCLYLSETKITDAALADLKRYPQLTHLHLQDTAITDAGLAHLAAFQNLTQLYLVGCRISDEGLPSLASLKNLSTLWLEDTDVTAAGICWLKQELPYCLVSSSFSEREIAAEHQQISIKKGMNANSLNHIREVAQWLASKRAEFGVTVVGGDYVRLLPGEKLPEKIVQLNNANLEGNKAISNEDLARFDKFPLFTTLGLSLTTIGDDGLRRLGELPLLKELYLSETAVRDAGLEELHRFPKLEVLHLYGTRITDAGLEHLAHHQMLVEFSLAGCNISDAGMKHLAGLKRLKILIVERTDVTLQGIAQVQLALPECEIRSDFTERQIAEATKALRDGPKAIEDQ